MTNYELILQINDKARSNIEKIKEDQKIDKINENFAFLDDLNTWISYCERFQDMILVKEAQGEGIKSILLCMQGFYKEAMMTLRRFVEHMLFAIWLSTNDYLYRMWKRGKFDMSWAQIVDREKGVFAKDFINCYAPDIDDARGLELLVIAKDIYRECSEYVHGNYNKLIILSNNMNYDGKMVQRYLDVFENVKYLLSMSLLIRYRDILNEGTNLSMLESIIMDNLGILSEVQLLYSAEVGDGIDG